ncbi:HAD family hydrolase [Bacillus sp. A301a_S52]|jgi:phosphoglycolate phosphatase|nr:HAD family hydrolase [Bacillus sp. A301a_S52]UJW56611.1 HAD family hydrolase [Bacillus sp. A116_S68]
MIRVADKEFPVDTVLFDKDGTLVDFESLWFTWIDDIHSFLNSSLTIDDSNFKQDLRQSLGISDNTVDPKSPLAIGSLNDSKIIIAYKLYKRGTPWDQAIELVTESIAYANKRQSESETIKPIKGIEELLSDMKESGMTLGVLTADETDQAEQHLQTLKIAHYFDFIIGNDQVEKGKPYPDMAYLAADRHDFSLDRAVMIGDTNGDMKLGKHAGTHASIGIITYAKDDDHHLEDADCKIDCYSKIQVIK